VETVDDGWNHLAGTDTAKIIMFADLKKYPSDQRQVFGNGKSAKKIIHLIKSQ
jgi:hypothetical protein